MAQAESRVAFHATVMVTSIKDGELLPLGLYLKVSDRMTSPSSPAGDQRNPSQNK